MSIILIWQNPSLEASPQQLTLLFAHSYGHVAMADYFPPALVVTLHHNKHLAFNKGPKAHLVPHSNHQNNCIATP